MRARLYRQRRRHESVESAMASHGSRGDSLLPVLQESQLRQGHLDDAILGATADALKLSDAHTFGVATFYSMLATRPRECQVLRICDGPACMACGGGDILRQFEEAAGEGWTVERTSCPGLCDRAPAALVGLEPCGPLSAESAATVLSGWRGKRPCYADPRPGEVRIAMEHLGRVDPDDIQSALKNGAYSALAAALRKPPAKIIDTIQRSGLQGRGGAGFPTGRKWRMVAEAAESPRYIVCNGDESEPAVFKDRVLMEGHPHLTLEGMALAAYAVGAREGRVYIRGEYEEAARRLEKAIQQAVDKKWLGEDIQGSGFSFCVRVHRGAGAYICGEETALLESLEGKRGEPRVRPPYPTTNGLWGKPTVVNNVETFCQVPAILLRGADWYRQLGTPDSAGTKVFTVCGHVRNPGAFEAPFGITLRQVIDRFGGGMRHGSTFKMALTGGAAGTIVGPQALDVPLDYAGEKHGISLGSGGILVLDQSVSVAALLGWLLRFFEVESCGKCTPCREGTRQARQLVERLGTEAASQAAVDDLHRLARLLELTSLCGLGQSVAWPINSALRNFGRELLRPDST